MYADDTQIYGFCRPTAASQLQQQVSVCIDDVALWMRSNRLQLNTAKTEVIWCASSRRQHQLPCRMESWHRLRHANNLSPRPRNLRRFRRVHADPRVQDRVQLLRHITPVAQHSSVDVTSGTGRLAGVVAPGLWQRDARRSTRQPA